MLRTKSNKRTYMYEYKTDTGGNGNLMPITIYKTVSTYKYK